MIGGYRNGIQGGEGEEWGHLRMIGVEAVGAFKERVCGDHCWCVAQGGVAEEVIRVEVPETVT